MTEAGDRPPPPLGALRALASVALAAAVAAGSLLVPYLRYRGQIDEFSRFHLPAFDPYVYVAMAEQPSFFSVAPWGYRVLTPWTVHLLARHNVVLGFCREMVAGFVVAGVLLFLFMRALGHSVPPSLAATALFEFSAPVAESVRTVFVAEPLSAAIEIAFLLGVQAGAPAPVLCLLLTLMAASKEIWVLLLPMVFLAAAGTRGRRLAVTAAAGVPPLVVALALRWWWAPHIRVPRAEIGLALAVRAVSELQAGWSDIGPGLVLGGVTPLALLGILHPAGRAFARRHAALALALTGLAFTAWLYIPSREVTPYYGANSTRLMVYVLPILLPMGAFAIAAVVPSWRPARPMPWPRGTAAAAIVGTAVCLVGLFALLDPYRRLPLHDRRDGPVVLEICRESLRTARRLDGGHEVRFDLRPGEPLDRGQPFPMSRLRWYLREGWSEDPQYTVGPVRTSAADASILLPCLRPRDLQVTLDLDTAEGERPAVLVNGRSLGHWQPGAPLRVPRAVLFRGDNLITLRARPGTAVLRGFAYAPDGAP